MKQTLKNKNRDILIWLVSTAVLLLPFFFTIILSTPDSCDDFDNAYWIMYDGAFLKNSVAFANNFYLGWSGEWFCNFILGICSPLVYRRYDGSGHLVGAFLLTFFVIFIVALTLFMYHMEKYVLKIEDRRLRLGITFLVMFAFMNSGLYTEVYYWFTGNSYLWRITALMISMTLIIRFMVFGRALDGVLLSVMGFITCFSNLLAVSTAVFFVFMLLQTDKIRKFLNYIPLVFMVLGGCISAFAPGNFARHSSRVGTARVSVRQALIYACQNSVNSLVYIYTSPVVLLFVMILFYLGYRFVRFKTVSFFLLILGQLVSLLGLTFPLSLGYADMELPPRVVLCINLVMYIWIVIISLHIGEMIYYRFGGAGQNIRPGEILAISIVAFLVIEMQYTPAGTARLLDLPVIRTYMGIAQSSEESRYYRYICKELAESSDDDPVVYIEASDVVPESGIIQPLRLGSDTSDPRNKAVALYYGKNTVSVVIDYNE